jgi:CBS domain-containing protein
MNAGEICSRVVVLARPGDPLAAAARDMIDRGVGAVVVVDPHSHLRVVGIVTDRDAVCGQLAKGADLHCLTVGDVMTPRPLTVTESMGISEVVEALSARGVRRAPVVSNEGALVGIVTFDDLLPAIADDLHALGALIGSRAPAHQGIGS